MLVEDDLQRARGGPEGAILKSPLGQLLERGAFEKSTSTNRGLDVTDVDTYQASIVSWVVKRGGAKTPSP